MKRPFLLWKRGRTWYYTLPKGKHYLSTGQNTRSVAEQFVIELIHQERGSVPRYYSFRRYAEPFFVWDRCPHVRRLREEGKSITRRHAKIQRIRLEKHVLPDPFSLSDAHIKMTPELGLNPRKIGSLANTQQETWKLPLPEFIDELYFKHFKKSRPENVRSTEQMVGDANRKKEERRARNHAAAAAGRRSEGANLPWPCSPRLPAVCQETQALGAGVAQGNWEAIVVCAA